MAASGVDVASSHHEETAAAAGDAEMTQADATPVVHEVASQEEVTPVSLDEEMILTTMISRQPCPLRRQTNNIR